MRYGLLLMAVVISFIVSASLFAAGCKNQIHNPIIGENSIEEIAPSN